MKLILLSATGINLILYGGKVQVIDCGSLNNQLGVDLHVTVLSDELAFSY